MTLLLRGLVRAMPPRVLWRYAANEVGLTGTKAVRSAPNALGWTVVLRLRAPATVAIVAQHADALAVAFGVAAVKVLGDPNRADRALVALHLAPSLGRLAYPPYTRPLWLPTVAGSAVPLGKGEDGDEVSVRLYGGSLLLGGNPGSGKSTAVRACLAALAGHRDTALVGIDPKRVELTPWRDRLSALVVGNEPEPTARLLRNLVAEVQNRAEELAGRGQFAAMPTPEMPALVLVVDEWAELAAGGTTKERAETQDHLRRFVSLGRAVGCSAILATQRPTSDTVHTGTRALLAHRLALRCGDKWQSEAILGQGLTDAARIPLSSPGWGYLAGDEGLQGIQIYDLNPDRIPDFTFAGLRIDIPWNA